MTDVPHIFYWFGHDTPLMMGSGPALVRVANEMQLSAQERRAVEWFVVNGEVGAVLQFGDSERTVLVVFRMAELDAIYRITPHDVPLGAVLVTTLSGEKPS